MNEQVKAAIKDKGYLQKEVGEALGFSEQYMSHLLSTPPKDVGIFRIIKFLGLKVCLCDE